MRSRLRYIVILAGTVGTTWATAGPVLAQQADSDNVLVARYSIAPEAFAEVTSSSDLVDALRQGLAVEAAMPLAEPLRVSVDCLLVNPPDGNAFPFGSGRLTFVLDGGTTQSAPLADAVRSSREDGSAFEEAEWNEDEAWAWYAETLSEGLTESLAADGRFGQDDEGNVPLTVAAVHTTAYDDWETERALERTFLRIQPSPRFESSSDAEWEAPEGFRHDIQILLIELEPGPTPELAGVELSAEVLDGLVGNYDTQRDGSFAIRRDGDTLVGVMERGGETREFPLKPLSETRFLSDTEGQRVDFEFEVDEAGRATSVTLQQGGFGMTFPRIP